MANDSDYVRFWFTFDLTTIQLPSDPPGVVRLDGDSPVHRVLWRGIGVTGLDEIDCLQMIKNSIAPDRLPPVKTALREVDVSTLSVGESEIGVPVWRGVWFPALNRGAPDTSNGLLATTNRYEFTVWFLDGSAGLDDENREWPAVIVIAAGSERAASEWGTFLAADYAERTNQQIVSTDVVAAAANSLALPVVRFGEHTTDEFVGW